MSLVIFPLAEEVLGQMTDAGALEALRQTAMFIGVIATLVYPGRFSIRIWLFAQLTGYLAILVGFQFGIRGSVYIGLCADGVSFAVLERGI